MRHSTVDAALRTEKLNLLKKHVSVKIIKCFAVSELTTSVRSAVFRPGHRTTIVLLLVYCPVNITLQKFAVRVCQATIVVMETTQLVLSQF